MHQGAAFRRKSATHVLTNKWMGTSNWPSRGIQVDGHQTGGLEALDSPLTIDSRTYLGGQALAHGDHLKQGMLLGAQRRDL